ACKRSAEPSLARVVVCPWSPRTWLREDHHVWIRTASRSENAVPVVAPLAMGRELPVIWLCRADQIDAAHLGTRQYNHIVWKEPANLREKLAVRIRAVVGLGRASGSDDSPPEMGTPVLRRREGSGSCRPRRKTFSDSSTSRRTKPPSPRPPPSGCPPEGLYAPLYDRRRRECSGGPRSRTPCSGPYQHEAPKPSRTTRGLRVDGPGRSLDHHAVYGLRESSD